MRALEETARSLRPGGSFLMMEHGVPDRLLIRLLFYIRLFSMGLRKAFEVLGHEEALFRRCYPVVETFDPGTGRSKIIMGQTGGDVEKRQRGAPP